MEGEEKGLWASREWCTAAIKEMAESRATPFYLYDEDAIRARCQRMAKAFSWCTGFRNFFAVKATPNPHILQVLLDEGMGADCSSLAELVLAKAAGFVGEQVMFTSNNTPATEYCAAVEMGAVLNLDDVRHIEFVAESRTLPDLVSFRYNPGPLRKGNHIIGCPAEAKFGSTEEQLLEGYRKLRKMGISRFGIHTMVASNELDMDFFVETAEMVFGLVRRVWEETGVQMEMANLGGGIGIPYRPGEEEVDLEALSGRIHTAYERLFAGTPLEGLQVVMENGRSVTGPYGCLVTRVLHVKETYKRFVGVDACMANLMRPGLYGAYHHITVLDKASDLTQPVDVVGSLCENNDKFAVDRCLAATVCSGDILVIHDTGAHGHSMGFQYNGKLRCAEYLSSKGSVRLIRRGETLEDYFATLSFPGLPHHDNAGK